MLRNINICSVILLYSKISRGKFEYTFKKDYILFQKFNFPQLLFDTDKVFPFM